MAAGGAGVKIATDTSDGLGAPDRAGGRADSLETLSSVPVGRKIIEFLKSNGPATQREIGQELNLKQTTVSYNIRKLTEGGRVQGSGEKRDAVYSLSRDLLHK